MINLKFNLKCSLADLEHVYTQGLIQGESEGGESLRETDLQAQNRPAEDENAVRRVRVGSVREQRRTWLRLVGRRGQGHDNVGGEGRPQETCLW